METGKFVSDCFRPGQICGNCVYFGVEKVYQPLYERFIQHAIRAMLSYAPIQDTPASMDKYTTKKRL